MTPTFSVVTFKWRPSPGYRSHFTADHVNILRRQVARHYARPHRFICVTDDPAGIDAGIEIVPLWPDHAELPSPHGARNPSCFRRLRIFSREAEQWFGPRFVSMDLDMIAVGDLSPLWDRPEDIVLFSDTNPTTFYNGSMVLMTAGSRRQVWDQFDPIQSPATALRMGQFGSDQAWIGACLGPYEARWTKADGVYSYRVHLKPGGGVLPSDAKLVVCHGKNDPWSPELQSLDWVRNSYQ